MANRKVEEYAHKHGLSNNGAKRKLGKRARGDNLTGAGMQAPARGMPVVGTGKPKGASGGKG